MNVTFRTDASLDIGSGHVVRCLTLAGALHEQGGQCHFICREHPGNLIDGIRTSGFSVTALPMTARPQHVSVGERIVPLPAHADWLGSDWHTDADATAAALRSCRPDWLVVDHYALARDWERQVRPHCKRLMVIDDLADRPHDCDLLLDQNLGREAADYADLVPETCTVLAGTRYALLRREFAALREYSLRRRNRPQLRRLLITMGGVDRSNATGRVLDALPRTPLPQDCRVTVVMGQHAPWLEKVLAQAADLRWPCEVKVDVSNMAEVMADSDLAIGAAGSTSWERCVLGVPSLLVVLARNQEPVARSLARAGAARIVGGVAAIALSLPTMLRAIGGNQLADMSNAASALCDGRGADRVLEAMYVWGVQVRRMRADDLETVLRWRNHPDVRRWMYSSHEITPSEHREWYARERNNENRHLLVVEDAGVPFGFVQFLERDANGVADWGFYLAPGAPRGSGRRLGSAALNYAFTQLGLTRIRGEAVAFNERSIAFHRRLGFTDEGAGPDRSVDGRSTQPVCCFSLEARDWIGGSST